jgi:hypothetical protein
MIPAHREFSVFCIFDGFPKVKPALVGAESQHSKPPRRASREERNLSTLLSQPHADAVSLLDAFVSDRFEQQYVLAVPP